MYDGRISIVVLRKFEKVAVKSRKAELDLNFLKNCQSFHVFPKFLCFPLPNNSNHDVLAVRKRLLRTAITRWTRELRKLLLAREKLSSDICNILNSVDLYILQKAVNRNVWKAVAQIIKTHTKKLEMLTRNVVLPFDLKETVTNVSSCRLTSDQLDILKFGLTDSICPPCINKSDVFICFELIHDTMVTKLQDRTQNPKLVSALSHLAHSYSLEHRPTVTNLKSYKLLKDLKKNKNIVNLKLDKRNGFVVLDRTAYDSGILK